MTTTIAAAPAMAPHTARRVVKAVAGVALFAGLCGGVYQGAQALTAHANAPTSNVSYADQSTIDRTVAQANHSPARQGAFLTGADISGGDVRSAVVAVP